MFDLRLLCSDRIVANSRILALSLSCCSTGFSMSMFVVHMDKAWEALQKQTGNTALVVSELYHRALPNLVLINQNIIVFYHLTNGVFSCNANRKASDKVAVFIETDVLPV